MSYRLPAAIILAMAPLAGGWSGTGYAASGKPVFTSAPYHYRLSYPRSWTHITVRGANFSAASRDRNAMFSLTVSPGEASLPALADALKLVYPAFGAPDRRPSFGTTRLGSVAGEATFSFVTGRGGVHRYVYASNFSFRRHLYTLVAVVVDVSRPTTSTDLKQMRSVVSSVHLSS
jgi:hypothetical protein